MKLYFLLFIAVILVFPSGFTGVGNAKNRKKVKKSAKKVKKEVWNKTPMLLKKVKKITVPEKGMDRECVARLRAAGIKFDLLTGATGVKTPVRLKQNKLGGVVYRRAWNNKTAPFIFDCKMVENLILAGQHLRNVGIAGIYWTSAWRYSFVHGTRKLSNHSYGRAIDITAIDGGFGYAALRNHWESCGGCGRNCPTKKGRALRAFICATKGKGLFKTVYTPAYDALHRDHFHMDGPKEKYKLKVVVKPYHYGVEKNKEPEKDTKTGDKDSSDRNHWVDDEIKRDYEPPRSRPHHY
ncbi:MAG: extensin family protein [Deltaproteobacteria bacterium]|nr:extensin family protein [Deltaproteobacteria bacterium]